MFIPVYLLPPSRYTQRSFPEKYGTTFTAMCGSPFPLAVKEMLDCAQSHQPGLLDMSTA
jgi:hypothetical protein